MAISTSFVWLAALLPTIAYSLSVCDELDIAFLATPDAIIDSLDTIKTIMNRIMTDGSSDHTDYNLMLYGDNVPSTFQNTMNPIFNPTVVEDIRLDLQQHTGSASTIGVSDVIRQYKNQRHNNVRKPYIKRQRFKQFCDHNHTATQYIVFADDNPKVHCDTKEDAINVILKHNTTDHAVDNTCEMNVFTEYNLMHDQKEIMRLHSITCSAKVLDNDGKEMLLNHNAQFVDADTFLKCNFVFDNAHSDRLNPNKSYVYVMDAAEDYTTYKLNEYLIVTRDELKHLPDSCQTALVYRVTDISTVSVHDLDLKGVDANRTMRLNQSNNIFRLSVVSPRTVHEYIFRANIEKDQKMEPEDEESSRRLFIHVEGEEQIDDYSWTKSDTYGLVQGIDISYSVSFGLSLNVHFKMDWDLFSLNEEFEFWISGEYFAQCNFAVLIGKVVSIPLPDLIDVVLNTPVIWVGIIPVWIKPFLKINANVAVLSPVEVNATLDCIYRASYKEGYMYSRKNLYKPAYGLIGTDYYLYDDDGNHFPPSYDFGNGYTEESCAQANYNYETDDCDFFAYNRHDGSCHCISDSWGTPSRTTGWNLYRLGAECDPPETTCETDAAGCALINVWPKYYQLHNYEDQRCDSSCFLLSCSMYTCTKCNTLVSDVKIPYFSDEKISETKIISKECHKSYSVADNDLCTSLKEDDNIGFDLVIEPVIGVKLYEIINVYARVPFLIELRMQPIETNPSVCGLPSSTSMCASDSHTVYVSFRLTASWSLYLGAVIEIEDVFSQAMAALIGNTGTQFVQSIAPGIVDPSHEITIFEKFHLFSMRLGCLRMIDLSTTINSYLLTRCCEGSGASTTSTTTTSTTQSPITSAAPDHACNVVELSDPSSSYSEIIPINVCMTSEDQTIMEMESVQFVCDSNGAGQMEFYQNSVDCIGTPTSTLDPCDRWLETSDPCVATSTCDSIPCTYTAVEQWDGVTQCNGDQVATNAYQHHQDIPVLTGICVSDTVNTTMSWQYVCVVDATAYGDSLTYDVWYNSNCSGTPDAAAVPVLETGCELQNASTAVIVQCNQVAFTTTTTTTTTTSSAIYYDYPLGWPWDGCNVTYPHYLSDGYCDDQSGDYNTAPCFYDGGDCCEETCVNSSNVCGVNGYVCIDPSIVSTNNSYDMSQCNVTSPDWINDGYCDDYGGYNTAPCFYDGGDCCEETCVNSSSVCGTNGYDCIDPSIVGYGFNITHGFNVTDDGLSNCTNATLEFINDGWCDVFGDYNSASCLYDGGDCCQETCTSTPYPCGSNGYVCIDPSVVGPNGSYIVYPPTPLDWSGCNITNPLYVQDGHCDMDGDYNTAGCHYDGGDCCHETCTSSPYSCGINGYYCIDPSVVGENGSYIVHGMDWSACNVTDPWWLQDGHCDMDGDYNTASCHYDGGDCCQETCASSPYSCGINGYYCIDPSVVGENGSYIVHGMDWSACNVTDPWWLQDGHCDMDGDYNTASCHYDGGDCCQDTCVNATYTCGINGYDCIDPQYMSTTAATTAGTTATVPATTIDSTTTAITVDTTDTPPTTTTATTATTAGITDTAPATTTITAASTTATDTTTATTTSITDTAPATTTITTASTTATAPDTTSATTSVTTATTAIDPTTTRATTAGITATAPATTTVATADTTATTTTAVIYPDGWPWSGCNVAHPEYLNDGFCEGLNMGAYNTAPCHYDGGDCCAETCVDSSNICGTNGYDCIDPSVYTTTGSLVTTESATTESAVTTATDETTDDIVFETDTAEENGDDEGSIKSSSFEYNIAFIRLIYVLYLYM
eukprot:200566_1